MPPHITHHDHAGGVYASTCPSPRRTWWRRNATVQVGVALAPHGYARPDGAKRGTAYIVWTRLACAVEPAAADERKE
eukprot:scaffold7899_cov111-Isochrysis_galbana.AAC.7